MNRSLNHTPAMKPLIITALSSGVLLCAQAQMPPSFSVTELGPNHRVWHAPPDPLTGQSHAPVVELRSGMNYWDEDQAAWLPAEPSFVDSGDAFVADRIQHKTRLEKDINVQGAVSFMTPSGSIIRATPIAIALYNRVNGQFAVIGTLTNSTGSIVGPAGDTVLYEDAFAGEVCASLAYRVSHGSLEQDLVFTGKLDVGKYKFPTDNNTLVQVISEVYASPVPDITRTPVYVETNLTARSRMASPDIFDETIAYDENFFLGLGHAYTAPSTANTSGAAALVSKELSITANGTFLIESVQYGAIRDALAALPDCTPTGGHASVRPRSGVGNFCATLPKPPAAGHAVVASAHKARNLASVKRLPAGVTIDFVANVAQNQPLFACDTNYVVVGTVNIAAATSFEGGTVLKYQANASLNLAGAVTCASATIYRPVTLTAYDDNTIGESVGSGTVSTNGYSNPAISMGTSSLSLTNFHIRYAKIGIQYYGGAAVNLTLSHSQFVNCIRGVQITGCGSGSSGTGNLVFNNTLLATTTYPLSLASGRAPLNIRFCHCTFDQSQQLINGSWAYAVSVVSTNSSFTFNNSQGTGTYSGYNNGFYGNSGNWTFGSSVVQPSASPYQSAGAGNYYLAANSPYRGAGTANIDPGLLADLRRRTTWPPLVVAATTWTTSQTLTPQAQRNTGPPDIGYSYDPLDYALGWVAVTGATVSISNGVAIATFGTNAAGGGTYGLAIASGATLQSVGLPNNPNWFVQYNLVQEQPTTNWVQTSGGSVVSEFLGQSPGSVINCRFTQFSMPALAAPHFNAPTNVGPFFFEDCEFHGGKLLSLGPTLALTNCLLERVYTDLEPNDTLTTYLQNNLVFGGNFTFKPTNSVVQDNLFDRAAITNANGYTGTNAYVTNCSRLLPTQARDTILTNSPSYQVGPLGRFYQLTNSLLVNAGSKTADLIGLYHYAISTNLISGYQIKETNSIVDIGYHYVAVSANGNPIDTDGENVPDYLEDADGDGNADTGERNWQVSENGTTGVSGLQVFTPLK
jgi:hypothetical protein